MGFIFFGHLTYPSFVKVTLSVSGTLAKIPQPASNSPEARAMRCAFAEAVVARELCRSIFTDLYPSDSATQSLCEGLARIFSWLDSSHPEEAVVTRCQLARAMAKSCDPKQCATRSAEKVCMTLGSWLGDKDRRRQFAADLGAQFEKAIDLWLPLQRADQHVRADTDLNSSEWLYSEDKRARYDAVTEEEETPKDSDIIPAPVHDHPVDFPLVVLFPRIFVGDDILFHGFSLFADQRAVIAAKVEQKKQLRSGSRASNRRNSNQDQLPCLSPKDLRAIAGSSGQGSKLRDLYLLAGSDLSVRKEPSQIDGKGTELSDGASVLSHRSESGANRG